MLLHLLPLSEYWLAKSAGMREVAGLDNLKKLRNQMLKEASVEGVCHSILRE
jgi:hypothetical protein